jgi:hypothetical protein
MHYVSADLHSELTTQRQVTPKRIKRENKPEMADADESVWSFRTSFPARHSSDVRQANEDDAKIQIAIIAVCKERFPLPILFRNSSRFFNGSDSYKNSHVWEHRDNRIGRTGLRC